MDTFTVLDSGGLPVGDNTQRRKEITELLRTWLQEDYNNLKIPKIRRTLKEKYFAKNINVNLINPDNQSHSILEINCPDRSGVLACVGEVLAANDVHIKDARITTLGERVEDLFYITDMAGKPLNKGKISEKLCADIKYHLEAKIQ